LSFGYSAQQALEIHRKKSLNNSHPTAPTKQFMLQSAAGKIAASGFSKIAFGRHCPFQELRIWTENIPVYIKLSFSLCFHDKFTNKLSD